MKTKFVLASVVAALSGLAGLSSTAKAGTDVHLNINLGSPHRPVVIVPAPGRGPGWDSHDRRGPAPRGYWKEIVVKTWVPARWVVSCDRRGREVRTFERGYFAYRTDRVWVASNDNRGDYGRRG